VDRPAELHRFQVLQVRPVPDQLRRGHRRLPRLADGRARVEAPRRHDAHPSQQVITGSDPIRRNPMRLRFAKRLSIAPLVCTLLFAAPARAQDANYWSIALGTRAQLLGGVVIGSPGDISSVYYNPGALALTQSAELLLAGSAYAYQRVAVDDGSG